jgi:hypothetical protein
MYAKYGRRSHTDGPKKLEVIHRRGGWVGGGWGDMDM